MATAVETDEGYNMRRVFFRPCASIVRALNEYDYYDLCFDKQQQVSSMYEK